MTEREKELVEIARKIIKYNRGNLENLMLTGSLMLALRGIPKRREAQDIDFICNEIKFGSKFPIMTINFGFIQANGASTALNSISYTDGNIKVDFMYSEENIRDEDVIDGIPCASVYAMKEVKKEYAELDNSEESRFKHSQDIKFLNKTKWQRKLTMMLLQLQNRLRSVK